jgi:hypothetical protein
MTQWGATVSVDGFLYLREVMVALEELRAATTTEPSPVL